MQGSRGSACSQKMKLLSEIKKFFNRGIKGETLSLTQFTEALIYP
jgi:hypothetical protein